MSTNQNQKFIPKLCFVCKDMYGNPSFNQMCSKCFKNSKNRDNIKNQEKLQVVKKQTQIQTKKEQQNLFVQKIDKKQDKLDTKKLTEKLAEQKQQEQPMKPQVDKCFSCKKKIGILGYLCKHCDSKYCKMHRLPEDHQCKVDFVTIGKKKLTQENPLIETGKIQKI